LLYGVPFKAGAVVARNVALPCATQDELNGSEATVLVKNGCIDLEGLSDNKALAQRLLNGGSPLRRLEISDDRFAPKQIA
jgi:hypothetical protein